MNPFPPIMFLGRGFCHSKKVLHSSQPKSHCAHIQGLAEPCSYAALREVTGRGWRGLSKTSRTARVPRLCLAPAVLQFWWQRPLWPASTPPCFPPHGALPRPRRQRPRRERRLVDAARLLFRSPGSWIYHESQREVTEAGPHLERAWAPLSPGALSASLSFHFHPDRNCSSATPSQRAISSRHSFIFLRPMAAD